MQYEEYAEFERDTLSCDDYDRYEEHPEACIFGGAYSPGTETCDILCSLGPCMTDEEYSDMMEDEYRYQRYLDRKEQTGWRGKFWRGWYSLSSLRFRLPRLPRLEACEICGRQYLHTSKWLLYPTCSDKCYDKWLPF